jgi:hypothetical protein
MNENQDLVFMASAALYSPVYRDLRFSNEGNEVVVQADPHFVVLMEPEVSMYELDGRKVLHYVGRLFFDRRNMRFVIKGVNAE